MNYELAYRVGFHPWEDAETQSAFREKLSELFDHEERGRERRRHGAPARVGAEAPRSAPARGEPVGRRGRVPRMGDERPRRFQLQGPQARRGPAQTRRALVSLAAPLAPPTSVSRRRE